MNKALKWIGTGIVFLFLLLFLISMVVGLINDTTETLIIIGTMSFIGLAISGSNYIYRFSLKKSNIAWESYPELRGVLFGIGCSLLLYIIFMCLFPFMFETKEKSYNGFDLHLTIKLIPVIIFSGWTYIALLLGKPNALLLSRSYIIAIVTILGYGIIKFIPRTITLDFFLPLESNNHKILLIIVDLLLFTLGIKGLTVLFTPKYIKPFKYQKCKFVDILLIVLLAFLTIIFNRLNTNNNPDSTKEYPALNQSK